MGNDHDKMDADEDDFHGHVQPLMEMSQDCIVEWNESPDSGIPKSSFSPTTPFSSTTTPKVSSGQSDEARSGASGLEEIRRKLEDENNGKYHQSSSNNNQSGEEEIDAIFRRLQEGLESGSSLTDAATQRTGNRLSEKTVDIYRKRPTVSSLASRRRRRQRAGGPALESHTREQQEEHRPSVEGEASVPTGQQCNTPPPNVTEGSFASLLKQLTRRQTSEEKNPLPILEKENHNPLPMVYGSTTKSPLQPPATVNHRRITPVPMNEMATKSLSSKRDCGDSRYG